MKLSPEQEQTVTSWIAEGESIAGVQKRLEEEFEISITYMDARFLIDDLNLELKDKKPTPSPTADLSAQPPPPPSPDQTADQSSPENADGGNVSIELDKLTRPGAVVSGDVTFSDGVTAKWALDQQGRLMLDASQENYQPSKEDLTVFQTQLSSELQSKGF